MRQSQTRRRKPELERKTRDLHLPPNNSDIRPFISIAEAAAMALSKALGEKKVDRDA